MNSMTNSTRQFKRIYAQCGSYYDRPILQSGEKYTFKKSIAKHLNFAILFLKVYFYI